MATPKGLPLPAGLRELEVSEVHPVLQVAWGLVSIIPLVCISIGGYAMMQYTDSVVDSIGAQPSMTLNWMAPLSSMWQILVDATLRWTNLVVMLVRFLFFMDFA